MLASLMFDQGHIKASTGPGAVPKMRAFSPVGTHF